MSDVRFLNFNFGLEIINFQLSVIDFLLTSIFSLFIIVASHSCTVDFLFAFSLFRILFYKFTIVFIITFPYYHIFTLPAVRIIHSYPSSFVIFSVNRANHLWRCISVNLNPAVHFFHINSSQNFFSQITHI